MECKGSCVCGEVTFTVKADEEKMSACHCSMCRHWVGGPWMGLHLSEPPVVQNKEALTVYHSSEWGKRVFCKHCGTSLFWQMVDDSFNVVSAGAIEKGTELPFKLEIYIDEKPDNYAFANDTHKMTAKEVMEAFS